MEHPDPAKHWKIRRYTMFVCIFLSVVFTIGFALIGWLNPTALESMTAVIGWFYSLLSVGVIGYFSNTALEEYAKNRKQ